MPADRAGSGGRGNSPCGQPNPVVRAEQLDIPSTHKSLWSVSGRASPTVLHSRRPGSVEGRNYLHVGFLPIFLFAAHVIPELTEQQTRPSSRSQPRSNDSIPRSQRSQQSTPLRRKSISRFTMDAHTYCPSFSRSPPPRNTASELSRISVGSRPGCQSPVLDRLRLQPLTAQHRHNNGASWAGQYSRVRRRRLEIC